MWEPSCLIWFLDYALQHKYPLQLIILWTLLLLVYLHLPLWRDDIHFKRELDGVRSSITQHVLLLISHTPLWISWCTVYWFVELADSHPASCAHFKVSVLVFCKNKAGGACDCGIVTQENIGLSSTSSETKILVIRNHLLGIVWDSGPVLLVLFFGVIRLKAHFFGQIFSVLSASGLGSVFP